MAHTIEVAASGRAKCRGCGRAIAKGTHRLGERLPNPYGEGEMTLWFHPRCGAYKRPEALLEALASADETLGEREHLHAAATASLAHRRLPRLDAAERSPSGQARCRSCRERIAKDAWRIRLVYFEEGRFNPSGFIHAGCVRAYCETADVLERLRHFSAGLGASDVEEVQRALADAAAPS